MENTKKCPYSGEYFKPKRSNQKFASKKNRIAYYNQKYRERRLPLEHINQRLFFNYSILEIALDNENESYVDLEYLKDRGFNFTLFTQFLNHEDEAYFGLYDIAFKKLDNNTIQIKRYESNSII